MMELRNVLNIKEYCEKLRSKSSEKCIFPKRFGNFFGTFYFRKKTDVDIAPPPPPSPPCSGINVLRGGGMGPPNFLVHPPPQPDIARYVPGSGKRPINKLVDAVLILCTVAL